MSNKETASETQSSKSNDNIHVDVTQKPRCKIQFDIKVTPKAVEAAYHKALKSVNKEVIFPGFRKGKAPNEKIIEKYGDVIQKEFVDLVLQTGFNEAIQLTDIHPLKDGHVKRPVVHECSREKGASFTIEFESRPLIPAVKLDEIEIEKAARPPITDQERSNALNNLLLQLATYEPIEDRPVQEGDFVNVSVKLLGEHPREVIQNQRTQVNGTGLPSWLRQKVIGLRAGDSAEGMTEQDSDLIQTDPEFKSQPFQITVHSISQGNLPALDDELAKRVGLQTLDELREKINERLVNEVEEEAFRREVHAIENLLIERYPIDIPQSYIDSNKDMRMSHYLDQLEKEKRDYTEQDLKKVERSLEESSVFNLQLYFLMRKIALDHNITVTEPELTAELSRQVALISSGRSPLNFNDKENFREQLHNLAMDRKMKEYLIKHVKFKS